MSITVNTRKKANAIIKALLKVGRIAIYEEFYTYTGKEYVIFYKAA